MPIDNLASLLSQVGSGLGTPYGATNLDTRIGPLSGLYSGEIMGNSMKDIALNQIEQEIQNQQQQFNLEQAQLGAPALAAKRESDIAAAKTSLPVVNPQLAAQVNVSGGQATIQQNIEKMSAADIQDATNHNQAFITSKGIKDKLIHSPEDWNNPAITDQIMAPLKQMKISNLPDKMGPEVGQSIDAHAAAAYQTQDFLKQSALAKQQQEATYSVEQLKADTQLGVADIMRDSQTLHLLLNMDDAKATISKVILESNKQHFITPDEQDQYKNAVANQIVQSPSYRQGVDAIERQRDVDAAYNDQEHIDALRKKGASLGLKFDAKADTMTMANEIAAKQKSILLDKVVQDRYDSTFRGVPIKTVEQATREGWSPEQATTSPGRAMMSTPGASARTGAPTFDTTRPVDRKSTSRTDDHGVTHYYLPDKDAWTTVKP